MTVLDLLLGPKCKQCSARGANIRICNECLAHVHLVRDHERYYNAEGRCRICDKTPGSDVHCFCYKCVPPHPDDTHRTTNGKNWWSLSLQSGGYDDPNGIMKIVSCPHCGGLLLLLLPQNFQSKDRVISHTYYRKGCQHSLSDPFYCDKKSADIVLNEQKNCSHQWLTVYKPIRKSEQEYLKELKSNEAIREFLDHDKTQIAHMARSMAEEKRVVMWCYNCGLQELRNE